jgi:hypothetical protein
VQFRSLAEPSADTGTSIGHSMLAVLGGFPNAEGDLISVRTAEGGSRIEARGKHIVGPFPRRRGKRPPDTARRLNHILVVTWPRRNWAREYWPSLRPPRNAGIDYSVRVSSWRAQRALDGNFLAVVVMEIMRLRAEEHRAADPQHIDLSLVHPVQAALTG